MQLDQDTYEDDDIMLPPEEPRTRQYQRDDRAFQFTCTDPFGLWNIKTTDQKALPSNLQGQYTSLTECEKAVNAHMLVTEAIVAAIEPVAPVAKPAPIKYKKPKAKE